ncbi:MAG: Gfo/Idh/MocA family oxidoreductase [Chloroflexota bacterium]|nr:Gfo/Idh/MocA family oxidoreductase [Chloroflexota bacterium]
MLKVGIIGTGNMGKAHARGWAHTPAQLVGFCSQDVRGGDVAAQYGVPLLEMDALLDICDAIDVCAPTHLHSQMVLRAAAEGKHIVCEKPLARTHAQGVEVVEACRKAGVWLLVAHVVRFFPEYWRAKQIVEAGEIGNVAVVRLTRASFQPRPAADNWFLDPEKSGGMILDLMIHDFDYARWIAGEVTSVFARSVRGTDPAAPEDYCLALLQHASGAISNIEGGWAYPPPLFRTALEIAGDAGLIEHPAGGSTPIGVHLKHKGGDVGADVGVPGSPLTEDPYTTEIKHFYDVLTGKLPTPRVTAEDALAALRIALAAAQSAQTGRAVQIAEVV